MQITLSKIFHFEAAHTLPNVPDGHKCKRLHGHSYRLLVHITGPIDPAAGWVMDFAELKAAVGPVIDRLDHRYLNDIPGLANSTAELLVRWLWSEIQPRVPGLARLVLWETTTSGCEYDGRD